MNISELLKSKKNEILKLAEKYGAYNARIFGSVARGEADEKSDVDFLVEFKPGVGLISWSGLWLELEDLLGRKVDVITEKALKSRIKEKVLREARPV